MTSQWRPMLGHLLASVVFVDGPAGSSAEFTDDEKLSALREVYLGTGLLRRLSESWGARQATPNTNVCGFMVISRTVRLSRHPSSLDGTPKTFVGRDAIWLDDAVAAMGFPPGPSLFDRLQAIRRGLVILTFMGLGVGDAFPVFVTKYPCHHPAHAALGVVVLSWPDVMDRSDLNDKVDRVFAHEIGHVFDAPDEYGHCLTSHKHGPFDTANANCVMVSPTRPNPNPQDCLMRENHPVACPSTELHWGWLDADGDGTPDLFASGTLEPLQARAGTAGERITVRGRNAWDARMVAFGDAVTDTISVVNRDEIVVEVPRGVTGIVNVSFVTRRGLAAGSFDDSWFLIAPTSIPTGTAPVVFGLEPSTAPTGATVKILGANLRPPTVVAFGSSAADLSGLDPFTEGFGEQLEVPVPAGPAGAEVEVTVTTGNGASQPFPPFSTFRYP